MSRFLGLFFIFLFPFLLYCESQELSLQINRQNWNIGIEDFSGSLSPSFEYLRSSFPDLIKKELISADTHILSKSEIDNYKLKLVEEERVKLINQLSQNYTKRDNLIFENDSSPSVKKAIDDEIEIIVSKLSHLSAFDYTRIKTAEMLQVRWVGASEDEGLLKSGRYISRVQVELYDLDFLISGSIKEIDEYFFIELTGFSLSDNEKIQIYSNAGTTDDIENMAIEAANELRSIILGRAWSILIVETDHEDALIYGDGELIGIGSAEVKTMEPGRIFLEAIGTDNSYWSSEVELDSLVTNRIEGTLSQSETAFLTLSTEPSEADVYIGARWAGKSPLRLPLYDDKNLWITIKSEGYYDKGFELSKDNPEDIHHDLVEVDLTPLENFELRKKQFYSSLGWFSLSVALPIVSQGISQNLYESDYYNSGKTTADNNFLITQGVFWGTIGISGGLLVNVFVKLSRYIKAAEALAQ